MDDAVRRALDIDTTTPGRDRTIDITTLGARSGQPRRIEIWFHRVDGRWWLTGSPGRPRAWLANLRSHPRFTVHLKHGITADLPATARVVNEEGERRTVLAALIAGMPGGFGDRLDLETMVGSAPLAEIAFDDLAEASPPAS